MDTDASLKEGLSAIDLVNWYFLAMPRRYPSPTIPVNNRIQESVTFSPTPIFLGVKRQLWRG